MPAFFWLLLIGLILFMAGVISYETENRKSLPSWAGSVLIIGTAMILIAIVLYLSNSLVPASRK
jgi:predicted membrane channel-forming protein YqfA (hemolysin III family)